MSSSSSTTPTPTPRKSNILLVGSGGVGTIASVALEHSKLAEVTSVLRSDYEKVKEHGFEIQSIDHGNLVGWKPSYIAKSVQEAVNELESRENKKSNNNNNDDDTKKNGNPIFDYIVVVIKALPELVKTEDLIAPAMKPRYPNNNTNNSHSDDKKIKQDDLIINNYPTVVLIQNGIDIEEPIVKAFPGAVVLSGISMIGSHNFGGRIEQYEHDILSIGYFNNGIHSKAAQEARAKEFVSMYSTTGVDCTYAQDVMYSRWRKLVYNSTINTMCGLMRLDVGRCYLASIDESIIIPAMYEILEIARASGHNLGEEVCDKMMRADEGLYYKPSMQIDIEKGNPIELEVILGNPLRIAKKLGIKTPILSVVYNLLKGVQFRLLEGRGLITPQEKGPKWTDPRINHHSFPSQFPFKKEYNGGLKE